MGCSIGVNWVGNWPQASLNMKIEGRDYQGESQKQGFFTTYLAVRDKSTGATRLVESCPLVLHPQVSAPATRNKLLLSEKPATDASYAEKMVQQKALIKNFGRQTGARYYQKAKEQQILKAASSVDVDKLPSQAEEGGEKEEGGVKSLLPPRDETAVDLKKVYKVEDLLTKLELDCLGDAADKFFATRCDSEEAVAALVKEKQISKFGANLFSECLSRVGDLGSKPGLAIYMEGIIRFTKLRPGERRKGPCSLQKFVPLVIGKKIFNLFGAGEKKDLVTPELQDKAICFIIVLGLLASHYKMDTTLLTDSVFVRADHLKKLVAIVGAYMVASSKEMAQYIVLKLPLAQFDINYKPRVRAQGKK